MDAVVRMGEAAVSGSAGDTLACIGLGSCIGLALYDRSQCIAGLAHVMLPAAPGADAEQPGKYADLAVPAIVEDLVALGAGRTRLEAVMVGGAAMFSMGGSGQDIGQRNADAVRAALDGLRIPVRTTDTGGGKGRTIRIDISPQMTTVVREAGGTDALIFGEAAPVAA